MTKPKPEVAFLGICERADYNKAEMKWNVIGLKQHLFSYIYPTTIKKVILGLSIKSITTAEEIKLRIRQEDGKEVFFIDMRLDKGDPSDNSIDPKKFPLIAAAPLGWSTIFVTLEIQIQNPGKHFITIGDEVIGELSFYIANPPPLTFERIAAIKSDPNASKAVRIELGCKKCTSKLRIYAALENNKKLEEGGFIPRELAPDEFICECGETRMNTQIIKNNLHGFLGSRSREIGEVNLTKMYEKSSLERIRAEFSQLLLEKKLLEEKIQKFIEHNPILLHQFVPNVEDGIIFKPKFSNKFIGDFAFTTPQNELLLIEIEPLITLTTKGGRMSSKLTHAFGQVNDWLNKIDDHKAAVLDDLGVQPEKVGKVRGVVIAGRNSGHDQKQLRNIKRTDHGRVSFFTYDDILSSIDILIDSMKKL